MDFLTHPTAVDGRYAEADPQTGFDGTVLTAEAQNAVLEELVGLIQLSGQTPDGADLAQVAKAVQIMAAGSSSLANLVINGGFDIWQRGSLIPVPGLGEAVYTADRWEVQADGVGGAGVATVSRRTVQPGDPDVPGSPYFLRYEQTTPANLGGGAIRTKLEALRATSGKSVTVSFSARADSSRQVTLALSQVFGGPAIPAGTAQINLTDSWQRFEHTFTVPSILNQAVGASSHLQLELMLPTDAGPVIDLAQVQVEIGVGATLFTPRTLALEEHLCRRYFEKSYPLEVAPGTVTELGAFHTVPHAQSATLQYTLSERFAVPKRAVPTVAFYSPASPAPGRIQVNFQTIVVIAQHDPSTAGTGYPETAVGVGTSRAAIHWTADAEL